ncbi:unnamed protein product [Merluccius merluccius]
MNNTTNKDEVKRQIAITALVTPPVAAGSASSGIAVLSPSLFTLGSLQHLGLTPGMPYRQRGSHGEVAGKEEEEAEEEEEEVEAAISGDKHCVYAAIHLH